VTGTAAPDFVHFVDRMAHALAEHSPTFEAFVAAMPGVLPDEALTSLRRVGGPHARRLAEDARRDRAETTIDQCAALPLPPPLDSEFRFDATTARILARSLVEVTGPGDEILLIGVPSVAVEIAGLGADRTVRFLGPDNCVTAAVRSAFGDAPLLLDQGPGGTAAAALLDPPWYAEPMEELIGVCAAGCRQGALVTLVLPPAGTRPDVAADRAMFLAIAAAAGMTPTGAEGPVCYRTPLFELSALERQGIARLPCWRRADAVELALTGERADRTWIASRPVELSVGGIRLRLVRGEADAGTTLAPIGGHEVFPSVSTRAPGRSRATLWTTANRAFAIDHDAARAALDQLARAPHLLQSGIYLEENDPPRDPRVEPADHLIHQLVELVGREIDDACRLVGDGAWLVTKMEWRC
jgi:hypothetical protein